MYSYKQIVKSLTKHIHTDEEIEQAARERLEDKWDDWQHGVVVTSATHEEGHRMFSVFHEGRRCYHLALPERLTKDGGMAMRDVTGHICGNAWFRYVAL